MRLLWLVGGVWLANEVWSAYTLGKYQEAQEARFAKLGVLDKVTEGAKELALLSSGKAGRRDILGRHRGITLPMGAHLAVGLLSPGKVDEVEATWT